MALIEIDGLPINSMVMASMANWQCHNRVLGSHHGIQSTIMGSIWIMDHGTAVLSYHIMTMASPHFLVSY